MNLATGPSLLPQEGPIPSTHLEKANFVTATAANNTQPSNTLLGREEGWALIHPKVRLREGRGQGSARVPSVVQDTFLHPEE